MQLIYTVDVEIHTKKAFKLRRRFLFDSKKERDDFMSNAPLCVDIIAYGADHLMDAVEVIAECRRDSNG